MEQNTLTNFKVMFAGGFTGVISWLITYPFDTLKTIIQTSNKKVTLTQMEAYKILSKETNSRIMSLYKGLFPTLVRAFFTNAVIFYTNDKCHNIFDKILI